VAGGARSKSSSGLRSAGAAVGVVETQGCADEQKPVLPEQIARCIAAGGLVDRNREWIKQLRWRRRRRKHGRTIEWGSWYAAWKLYGASYGQLSRCDAQLAGNVGSELRNLKDHPGLLTGVNFGFSGVLMPLPQVQFQVFPSRVDYWIIAASGELQLAGGPDRLIHRNGIFLSLWQLKVSSLN